MLNRAEIEKRMGRRVTSKEFAQQHADGRPNDLTREQIAARIPVFTQKQHGRESFVNWRAKRNPDGSPVRESIDEARQRWDKERQAKNEAKQEREALLSDPQYQKVNAMAARIYDDVAWDVRVPESKLLLAQDMVAAAKAADYERFAELNREWVNYRQGVVAERQSIVDSEIAALKSKRESIAGDEYEPQAALPVANSYSHIRRASGKMQFVNRADGHIVEYDPLVPFAKENALKQLGEHQRSTEPEPATT